MKEQQIEYWPLDRFIEYARNPRRNDHAVEKVAAAIHEFGFRVPILAKSDGLIVDGHLRLKAARKLGLETVPVLLADDMTDNQVRAFRLSVNKMAELADWDEAMLALELSALRIEEFDLDLTGFDAGEVDALLDEEAPSEGDSFGAEDPRQSLADRFGVPPFSVLNAREGWWQDRKRAWIALGIQSELGRGGANECAPGGGVGYGATQGRATYTSVGGVAANATPGGSLMPAMDYSKRQRGDGAGRPIASNET